jgi:hypothetical protein
MRVIRPVFIALFLAACTAGCARNRPPVAVLDAIHDVARHAPVYVAEANEALDETAHPDAEQLKGIGERLVNALDALDRWGQSARQKQGDDSQ